MSVLPKMIYRFNIIPVKIPKTFSFCRIRKIHLKIHIEFQGTLNIYNISKIKNKVRGFILLDFKQETITIEV